MIAPSDLQRLDQKFNRLFFAPWHRSDAPLPEGGVALERFKRYRADPGYGENKLKHGRDWMENLEANADLEKFPNARIKGITIGNTDIRELPTSKPHFNFDPPSEGYPFDNLQYSAIAANTPVFVSHISRDKAWVLIYSHYGTGWVSATEVAFMEGDLTSSWEGPPLISVIKDDSPIFDQAGIFRFEANVGWMFPRVGENGETYEILVAVPDENRKAIMRKAFLPKKQSAMKPIPPTPFRAAALIQELLHKPYGWGGIHGNRDCSATLKDFFAPFGAWLPRDSKDQTHEGKFINLKSLPPGDKEKAILKDGVPFLTLIDLKGHVMLYIGRHEGKAVVFHNIWGVRAKAPQGNEGKVIIGRSILSTLHSGIGLPPAGEGLLDRVVGMTLLVPPGN